jgi:GNAT superfamily N-acetyltransferase
MFKAKIMTTNDYSFATRLVNTMDWNMSPADFQFMQSLEPEGCFVLFEGTKRLGIATSVSFCKVGWFGNLIVKEEYRNKGAGSFLVKHAVNYLQCKGAETIGLFAYPNLTHFYSKMGFTLDEDFSVLHAPKLRPVAAEPLPSVGKRQLRAIQEFDRGCFIGNRKKLLEQIILEKGNPSFYMAEGNTVTGYVAATVCEMNAWIGPLVCQDGNIKAAISLVKGVLGKLRGKSVYAVVPKKDAPLVNPFLTFGFNEDFFVSRMFLGRTISKNCIYMAESLERG